MKRDKESKKKSLRKAFLRILGLLGIAVAILWWISARAETRLQKAIAEARAAGMIVSAGDDRRAGNSDPNSKYETAYSVLRTLTPKERMILRDAAMFMPPNPNWSQSTKEMLGRTSAVTWGEVKALADRVSSAFELIDEANQMGPYSVESPESDHYSNANTLSFSTINAGRAEWMAGDKEVGLQRFATARQMASRIYASPRLFDFLRGCGLRQVLDFACAKLIFESADEESLDLVYGFLRQVDPLPDLRVGLRSEARSGLNTVSELRRNPAGGTMWGLDWKDRDYWRYQTLRANLISRSVSARFLETLAKHYRRLPEDRENLTAARDVVRDLSREVEADSSYVGGLAKDAGFDYKDVQRMAGSVLVRKRLLLAMIEIQRVKIRSNAFPSSLPNSAKGILDPYSGAALHYRRAGKEYLLYSVGTNGIDDGGATRKTGTSGTKDATLEFYRGSPVFRN